jgi:hypothetical protein
VVTTADGATLLARSADAGRWIGRPAAGTPFGTGGGVGERRDVTGQLRLFERVEVAGLGWRLYAGADPKTADTTGLLRADRNGDGPGRWYTLTYRAADLAGNTATCVATVTVPHDQSG